MSDLASVTDEELTREIARRERSRIAAYWAERIKNAKYLCPDCGMPDSAHTMDCPSDTDCT